MGLNVFDANRPLVDQVDDLFVKFDLLQYRDAWRNSVIGVENDPIDVQELNINRSLRALVMSLHADTFEVRQYIVDRSPYSEWLRLLERGVFPWLKSLTPPKNN